MIQEDFFLNRCYFNPISLQQILVLYFAYCKTSHFASYLSVTYFHFQFLLYSSFIAWLTAANDLISDFSIRYLRHRRTSQQTINVKEIRTPAIMLSQNIYHVWRRPYRAAKFISNKQTHKLTNNIYRHLTLYISIYRQHRHQ